MYTLSKYSIISDPFYEKQTGKANQVIYSAISGLARVVHPQIVDYLRQNTLEKIPDNVLTDLANASLLVASGKEENLRILEENRVAAAEENVLYHVIQPSAWCQLDCGYCGQSHEKKTLDQRKTDAIYQSIADALETGRYKHLHIGWFGGEPLAGMTVIRSLSRRFIALAADKGLTYSGKVVTNGMALTPKIFRELVALKVVHYEITLDGPQAIHDKSRPTKSGEGSYEKILDNLKKVVAIQSGQLITVRVNVGVDNFHAVTDLIDDMREAGLQQGVSVYFAPLHDWGNNAGEASLSIEDFSQYELMWYAKLLDSGFKLGLIPSRKKLVCMSLSPTSQVYDAYGDIFNCSELSQVPGYGTPNRHRLGNLDLIASTGGERLFADFNDKIERRETTCKDCYCLPVCGGACPKAWDEGNIPCPSFKFNFKQRLLLQYASRQTGADETQEPASGLGGRSDHGNLRVQPGV